MQRATVALCSACITSKPTPLNVLVSQQCTVPKSPNKQILFLQHRTVAAPFANTATSQGFERREVPTPCKSPCCVASESALSDLLGGTTTDFEHRPRAKKPPAEKPELALFRFRTDHSGTSHPKRRGAKNASSIPSANGSCAVQYVSAIRGSPCADLLTGKLGGCLRACRERARDGRCDLVLCPASGRGLVKRKRLFVHTAMISLLEGLALIH